jgi:lipopolysaccharide export system protein LptC
MICAALSGRVLRRGAAVGYDVDPRNRSGLDGPQGQLRSRREAPLGSDPIRRRTFAAAERHSRLVRFLRVATLAAALIAVAALILISMFDPFRHYVGGLSVDELSVNGSKIVMSHPRLTGSRKDGGGYVVNAGKAIRDVAHSTMVELREIDGDVAMVDGSRLKLSAAVGVYDSVRDFLKLTQDAHLRSELRRDARQR